MIMDLLVMFLLIWNVAMSGFCGWLFYRTYLFEKVLEDIIKKESQQNQQMVMTPSGPMPLSMLKKQIEEAKKEQGDGSGKEAKDRPEYLG